MANLQHFIVYSDSHHRYPGTAFETVLEQEIMKAENAITDQCVELKAGLLFIGDRTDSKNPSGVVLDTVNGIVADRLAKGIKAIYVAGNHDFLRKDLKYSNLKALENMYKLNPAYKDQVLFAEEFMSVRGFFGYDERFLIYPYGVKKAPVEATENHSCNGPQVVLFHDEVIGAEYETGVVSRTGWNVSDFDKDGIDLVLGGHIHKPQLFKFQKTIGGFVGAPVALRASDQGNRGWLHLVFDGRRLDKREFIKSGAPQFIQATFKSETNNIRAMFSDGWIDRVAGQYFILDLVVPSGLRRSLDRVRLENEIKDLTQVKALKLTISSEDTVNIASIPELSSSQSIQEDWNIYVSKTDIPAGVDAKEVYECGKKLIEEALAQTGGIV